MNRKTFEPGCFYYVCTVGLAGAAWLCFLSARTLELWGLTAVLAVAAGLLMANFERIVLDDTGLHIRRFLNRINIRWDEIGGFGGKTVGGMDSPHDDEVGSLMFRLYVRGTSGHVLHMVSPWIMRQGELRRVARAYMAERGQPYVPPS